MFDEAVAALALHTEWAGIGFVFSAEDEFCGVDLDGCIGAEGALVPTAEVIVDEFNSYTEVSPSGKGVKIFIVGHKPEWAMCKSKAIKGFKEIEVYSRDRFFTITGRHLSATPLTVEDRQLELDALCTRLWPKQKAPCDNVTGGATGFDGDDDALIAAAIAARNGAKFDALWSGSTSGHGGDDSAADLALCSMLAFWTRKNAVQMDRLFRRSGLMREKWNERHSADGRTYGQMTIDKAIAGCSEVYSQPRQLDRSVLSGPAGVSLRPRHVARTPTRYTAKFAVLVDGKNTNKELNATDTSRGLDRAKRDLVEIVRRARQATELSDSDSEQVRDWLETVLTSTRLDAIQIQLRLRSGSNSGEDRDAASSTMLDIAVRHMTDALQPAFRTERGIWSERYGTIIARHEFVQTIHPALLEALRAASNYAAPTDADPTKPIKHLQRVLMPAWSAIHNGLPDEVRAHSLGPKSKAAAELRLRILDLWRMPETWLKVEPAIGKPGHAERMSLASRARVHLPIQRPSSVPWQRFLRGADAFYRINVDERGAATLWLGMRVGLCRGQIKGVRIDGVEDQAALAVLMRRYGLVDTSGVDERMREDGNQCRLVVLSRELGDLLLDVTDGPEAAPVTEAPVPDVTEGVESLKAQIQLVEGSE